MPTHNMLLAVLFTQPLVHLSVHVLKVRQYLLVLCKGVHEFISRRLALLLLIILHLALLQSQIVSVLHAEYEHFLLVVRHAAQHFIDRRRLRTQQFAWRQALRLCGSGQADATCADDLCCVSMPYLLWLQISSTHLVTGKVHLEVAIVDRQLVQVPDRARRYVWVVVSAKAKAFRLLIITKHELHVAIRTYSAQRAIQTLLVLFVQVIRDVAEEDAGVATWRLPDQLIRRVAHLLIHETLLLALRLLHRVTLMVLLAVSRLHVHLRRHSMCLSTGHAHHMMRR